MTPLKQKHYLLGSVFVVEMEGIAPSSKKVMSKWNYKLSLL